jgi:hypothetical protein
MAGTKAAEPRALFSPLWSLESLLLLRPRGLKARCRGGDGTLGRCVSSPSCPYGVEISFCLAVKRQTADRRRMQTSPSLYTVMDASWPTSGQFTSTHVASANEARARPVSVLKDSGYSQRCRRPTCIENVSLWSLQLSLSHLSAARPPHRQQYPV